jgi:hypothetical protein
MMNVIQMMREHGSFLIENLRGESCFKDVLGLTEGKMEKELPLGSVSH